MWDSRIHSGAVLLSHLSSVSLLFNGDRREGERGPGTWGSYGERRGTRGTRDTSAHELPQLLGDQFRQLLFSSLADDTVEIQNRLLLWCGGWKDECH